MVTKVKLLDSAVAIPSAATATTQSASDNSTKLATTAYVTTALANLSDSAPSTLNTLNELAAALGDDANFSTTVTNSIAAKLPLAGGSLTGALDITAAGTHLKFKRSSFDDFLLGTGTANSQNGLHITNSTDSATMISIHENAPASAFVMDNSGNIGIGTASPAVALDIAGSSTTQMRIQMSGQADTRVLSDTGTGIVGTYSNHPLTIKTNGSTAATIDTSGRLLAGTTSVGARSAHTLARTGAFAAEILQQQTSAGASVLGLTYDGAAPNNTTDYFVYARDTAGIKHLVRANGEGFFAGSVGIGTASPTYTLDVAGDMGINEYIYHNDDTNTYMRFTDDAWLVRAGGDDRIYVDGTNGRVGIGTNSPGTELHVNSGSSNNNTRFESTDTEVRLQLKDTTGVAYIGARNDIRFGNDTTTERMRLDSNGKLGIGVTSVNALLHLNGDGDAIRVESTNSGAGGAQVDLLHYSPSPADEDVNGVINFGGYYSGTNSAYAASIKSVWSDVSAKEGRLEFYTRDDSTFAHHMQINHHGGIAMGANNAGYDGQVLSIKAGTGDNVLYGESTDANCIVSLRDNSSTMNIGYGATGNAHIFSQDGSEIARISTGSADKYSYSGAGLGGSGTNLVLAGDDSEIKMANNFIHSDNSGLTQMTIRCGYGVASTGAELSLDAGRITFNTGSSFSEKMRIDSSGYLMYGTTSASSLVTFQGTTTSDIMTILTGSSGNNNVGAIVFRDGSADYCGQITCNGSTNSVSYVSSSDYRLKENVDYTWEAITRLNQLKPVRFNWISDDTNTLVDGFLAHEVSDIVPEAVVGEKDEIETYTDDEDNEQTRPKYQGVDHSKLIPLLTKAIQELNTEINNLKADIEALKG